VSDVKINQGKYYMVEWSLSQFDSASIRALDSSKILQDTVAPLILVEDMPATAIIRRVLDSIGYSNYNINVASDDKSIPVVRYFWTKRWTNCLGMLTRFMQGYANKYVC
jgi:hypothetical protein